MVDQKNMIRNAIPQQRKNKNERISVKEWNEFINVLKEQTNMNTKIIELINREVGGLGGIVSTNVYISETPPPYSTTGLLWWDPTINKVSNLKIFYVDEDGDQQWVDAVPIVNYEYNGLDGGVPADYVWKQQIQQNYNAAYDKNYKEINFSNGDPVSIDIWETNSKAIKLFTKTVSYTDGEISSVVTVDEVSGRVLTKTLTYPTADQIIISEEVA